MVRSGSTACNSAVESRTSGTVRRTWCPGEASSSSCNSAKLSPPARDEAVAGPLRPAVDAGLKASVERRRCCRSHWMEYYCCHSNRVDGTCDRSPCGSKTPVFNSVSARLQTGSPWPVTFWLCFWKTAVASEARPLRFGPPLVLHLILTTECSRCTVYFCQHYVISSAYGFKMGSKTV